MPNGHENDPVDLETLAGEYVLGVLDADERRQFEQLSGNVTDAADARLRWENRLQGLNDSYGPVPVPGGIKQKIDARLFPGQVVEQAAPAGFWNSVAIWRGLGLGGAAAAIALAIWGANINTELGTSRNELTAAVQAASEAEENLRAYEGELAARGDRLAALESELESIRSASQAGAGELAALKDTLAEREAELVAVRDELADALASSRSILVVSLTSEETDYRFLAVHEPGSDQVRMTRVAGEIEADRDYELWLVRPEGSTISLGVVPSGKTAVALTPEYKDILEGGGLLAVSIEQKGGSPTGVAQGPVVAVGAPEEL